MSKGNTLKILNSEILSGQPEAEPRREDNNP